MQGKSLQLCRVAGTKATQQQQQQQQKGKTLPICSPFPPTLFTSEARQSQKATTASKQSKRKAIEYRTVDLKDT